MPDFNEIPQFPHCDYQIHVMWESLERHLATEVEGGLDLNPDFQRGHVWTKEQQSRYVEYILRGGQSGKDLYFNHPRYQAGESGIYVIVDGKQRLEAVRSFLRGDTPAFGAYRSEWTGNMRGLFLRFSWNVASLRTRADVLEWYLDFNSGGTVHAQEEIDRVRQLLERERAQS
jgi:hypothetical protein